MAEAEDDARRDVYELERIIQAEEAKLMMMAPDLPKTPPLSTVICAPLPTRIPLLCTTPSARDT